ncbi:hypothetical protein VKT23_012728 [Stygiomarasmius scandens]|uniref:MRPL25 domain-containing protein n=1 Tax=Marasmiellus scandens TaxID=2682957 RepID=A0ABR1J697_9AGAR
MSVSLWSRVTPQQTSAIREGLRMARKIFANEQSSSGLTTSELYKLMLKEKPEAEFEKCDVKEFMFAKAGGKTAAPPLPPHPEHPIRSMSFLKHQVLPILEGNKEIRLATTTRIPTISQTESKEQAQNRSKGKKRASETASATTAAPSPITVRLWKSVTHPVQKTQEVNWGPYAKSFKPDGHEVGVGEDWGHLNRRRRRARLVAVQRDHKSVVAAKRLEALTIFQKEREQYEALKLRRYEKMKAKRKAWIKKRTARDRAAKSARLGAAS